ncbi:MAG: 6-phosphofructokinase [Eubacterium sp.]|nr:6-phosphofructokinase [Eubacterium sp.]
MSNIIVAQSGGPTSAINASLIGVVRAARESETYDKIYGALHGISGVINEDFLDMTDLSDDVIIRTPASYLGSCRVKMPMVSPEDETYKKVFEIFGKYDVGAFFYIGGNDSMDTVDKLSKYAKLIGSNIRFAGVPKTIDNDLVNIDHTPGYGSAAKFIASTMLEIGYDTAVYEAQCVTIVEIMGRNAGWLTAAAALARNEYNPTPQLVYLPEVNHSVDEFIDDVKRVLEKTNNVVVAVSEGMKDKDGNYLTASDAKEDKFGHAQLSGVGKYLESVVIDRLGIKCRSVELNILQRCAGHMASETDLSEAENLGWYAVEKTIEGNTGFMASIKRVDKVDGIMDLDASVKDEYSVSFYMVELDSIANQERCVPRNWINEAGNDVTDEMLDYIRPLIQGEMEISYKNGLPIYTPIPHLTSNYTCNKANQIL